MKAKEMRLSIASPALLAGQPLAAPVGTAFTCQSQFADGSQPAQSGTNHPVVVPALGPTKFYRLIKP